VSSGLRSVCGSAVALRVVLCAVALGGAACQGCGTSTPVPSSRTQPQNTSAQGASVGAERASEPPARAPSSSASSLVDATSWMSAQGLSGAPPPGACSALEVGVPLASGLVCRDEHVRLYRAQDGRLSMVWSAERTGGDIVLALEISAQGRVLDVTDAPASCERLYAEVGAKARGGIDDNAYAEYLQRACGARGRYEWSDGKYVRARGGASPPLDGMRDAWR
jgi:hypothetical protein